MEQERRARVIRLLEHNVGSELAVMNESRGLGLTDLQVENLEFAITSSILYAFDVDWAPDWVGADDVHAWQDGEAWFARCSVCLEDSPPSESRDDAKTWALDHERGHSSERPSTAVHT